MFRPMVLRKEYLDFLTKGFKMMSDLVVFKNHFLLLMVHSSLIDNMSHLKFIFFFHSQ